MIRVSMYIGSGSQWFASWSATSRLLRAAVMISFLGSAVAADVQVERSRLELSGFGAFTFGSGLGETGLTEVAGFRQFVTKQNSGIAGAQVRVRVFRALS